MQMVRSARAMALKYVDAVDGAAAPSRVPTALIEEVRRMLAQAFFFCTTAEETTEEAALRTEGLPRAGEQRLMRELKLIDAVFEVAYAAVRRGWLEAVKTVKNPLNGVTQLALRVLHRACVENGRNEYYLASRQEAGDTILAHLTELIPCKVGAVRLVNALLHDNRYLSEHLVDAHKINNFVSLLKSTGPRNTYMHFFRDVCSCRGEAVLSNQEDTLRHLYLNKEVRDRLLVETAALAGVGGRRPGEPIEAHRARQAIVASSSRRWSDGDCLGWVVWEAGPGYTLRVRDTQRVRSLFRY